MGQVSPSADRNKGAISAPNGGKRSVQQDQYLPLDFGKSGWIVWISATLVVALALISLTLLVRANPRSDIDVEILGAVSDWADGHGLDDWYDLVALVTGFRAAIAAMVASVIIAPLITRPNNVVAYVLTLFAFGLTYALADLALKEFVGVARPDPNSDALSYPSGHVAGVVTAGILFVYLLARRRAHLLLILSTTVVSIFVVYSVSIARLVQEAHWPSDILGGYLLGALGPFVFIPLYHRLERIRWLTAPRVGVDTPLPLDPEAIIAGSYGSAVVIEPSRGTATKYFDPPVMLRVLYWISFQKSFPYVDNPDAIEAALLRRRITGLVTQYRFGKNRVAPITRVDWNDGKAALVTEYIPGGEPENNIEAWDFLSSVAVLFEEAGLPGWQLNPHNPHAHTNLARGQDGEFVIIDMESGFVTPFPSRSNVRSSIKHGTLPVFDDIDFDRLRGFASDRAADLRKTLGEDGYAQLRKDITDCESAYIRWHKKEPRIWGRTLRCGYRTLNVRADFAIARRGLAGAQHRATTFLEEGVTRWEEEGRYTSERAAKLRQSIQDPSMAVALEHLGAHLMISTVLRFPIGSITRALWVLVFMLRATNATVRRRPNRFGGLGVHNPIVLLWAGLPGVGAIAYMFSRPLMKPVLMRLLLDEAIYRMPLQLHRRIGAARWLSPKPKADLNT